MIGTYQKNFAFSMSGEFFLKNLFLIKRTVNHLQRKKLAIKIIMINTSNDGSSVPCVICGSMLFGFFHKNMNGN